MNDFEVKNVCLGFVLFCSEHISMYFDGVPIFLLRNYIQFIDLSWRWYNDTFSLNLAFLHYRLWFVTEKNLGKFYSTFGSLAFFGISVVKKVHKLFNFDVSSG